MERGKYFLQGNGKRPLTGKGSGRWVKGSGGDLGTRNEMDWRLCMLIASRSLTNVYRGLEYEDENGGPFQSLHLRS